MCRKLLTLFNDLQTGPLQLIESGLLDDIKVRLPLRCFRACLPWLRLTLYQLYRRSATRSISREVSTNSRLRSCRMEPPTLTLESSRSPVSFPRCAPVV